MAQETMALWLDPSAAAAILGIGTPDPAQRWVVVGKLVADAQVGLWIDVAYFAATDRAGKVTRQWQVEPRRCLIKWETVIVAQRTAEPDTPASQVGFSFRQVT